MEMRIEDLKEKTKEAEDLTDHQTEQEDKYDERLRRMHEVRVPEIIFGFLFLKKLTSDKKS